MPTKPYGILGRMLVWMTSDLDETGRATALENLSSSLKAHGTPEGVAYRSAAWCITAHRP